MKFKISKKVVGGLIFTVGMALFEEIANIMTETQLNDQDKKLKELEEKVNRLEQKEEA